MTSGASISDVIDLHEHRCPCRFRPAPPSLQFRSRTRRWPALTAALDTRPVDVRPKVHLSSPRTESCPSRPARPLLLDQHADFLSPWDLLASTRPTGRWTSWSRRRRRISLCKPRSAGPRPANGKGGLAPRRRRRAESSPARRRAFVKSVIPAWPRAGGSGRRSTRAGRARRARPVPFRSRPAPCWPGLVASPIEREPEERAVRCVDREADRPGKPSSCERLAEQEDVGVVAAEEPVDRLQFAHTDAATASRPLGEGLARPQSQACPRVTRSSRRASSPGAGGETVEVESPNPRAAATGSS